MKKICLILFSCLFVLGLNAQNDKLIAKWGIFEMIADGNTYSLDKLKEFKKDKDYIEILPEGKFKMFDDGIMIDGTWEYVKEGKILKIVLFPTKEAKAKGQGNSSMKYIVLAVDSDYLTLKLGKVMTSKYKKIK